MRSDNPEELLPVVDENGVTIGSGSRSLIHSGSKLLHPVVHLHLFDSEGRLFLQKRPMWKDIQPGKWDSAVGGHIAYGERTDTALRREALEEVGLDNFDPVSLGSYIFESDREREIISSFYAVIDPDRIKLSDEVDDGRFWTSEEIEAAIEQDDILTPNFTSEYQRFNIRTLQHNKKLN